MLISITKMSELTGFDRRTIKKRIEHLPGGRSGYESSDALPYVYGAIGADEVKLDPQQEAAKLNLARREKTEIETKILSGELCRTEEVQILWAQIITNAKTKLLALPHKAAHQVAAVSGYAEAEKILKSIVHEALEELAKDGIPDTGGEEEPQ